MRLRPKSTSTQIELPPGGRPVSCILRTEQTAPSPSQSRGMHLHLLPLSGEATSAATVAKKGKKVNTIRTQEPDLAGEASTFSYRSYQTKMGGNYITNSYHEAVTRYKVWVWFRSTFYIISQLTPRSWYYYSNVFQGKVLLCSLRWPRFYCIGQAGLEFTAILLPQPPECWN